jgi:hypothetical protein
MNDRVIIATSRLPDTSMDFIYDCQNGQWDAQDEVSTTHPRYEATEDDLIRAKRDADTVAPMLTDIRLYAWKEQNG